jgi:hypothetical protein
MKDSGPIPIRFYSEFLRRDWPDIPEDAKDALANLLLKVQQNPSNPEIIEGAVKDAEGRFAFEFSPGYVVYWRVAKDESSGFVPPERIDVLAILKTRIAFSEPEPKSMNRSDVLPEEQDSIERVYYRTTSLGNLTMWGSLHVSRSSRKIKGWLVDSWSQAGPTQLRPKLHWVSFPDFKIRHVHLNVDFNSTVQVGLEDSEIEPERLIFIRGTLRQWEQDWLEELSNKTS